MDEKIVITEDECNRATPHVSTPSWTSTGCPEAPKPQRSWRGIVLSVVVTAFVLVSIGMAVYCLSGSSSVPFSSSPMTVAQYKAECIKRANSSLSDSNNALRKKVEDAHVTVNVTDAYVKDCSVTTFDGTDSAGQKGANVYKVTYTIRCEWTGFTEKGYTDLEIVIDKQTNTVLSNRIVKTTAKVNIDDPSFWWDVGCTIGLLLCL